MKLYNLTQNDYQTIINDVISIINFNNVYFTHKFKGLINNDIQYEFNISLFIYKNKIDNTIKDIVPIWWEFHTYDDFIYNEYMNDFNFELFKKMLIEHGNNF